MAVSIRKNSIVYDITTKVTVPAFEVKTGTIATVGTQLIGTGTLFLSEIKKGDWIVDATTNNEMRQVIKAFDNLTAEIDSPFTIDIPPGFSLNVVRSRAKHISLSNVGGADAIVDGEPLIPGETYSFPKSNKNPNGSDFIDPLLVDATGTTVHVLIQK